MNQSSIFGNYKIEYENKKKSNQFGDGHCCGGIFSVMRIAIHNKGYRFDFTICM